MLAFCEEPIGNATAAPGVASAYPEGHWGLYKSAPLFMRHQGLFLFIHGGIHLWFAWLGPV